MTLTAMHSTRTGERNPGLPRSGRTRTCVGCRASIAADDPSGDVLEIRVVLGSLGPDDRHEVVVDLAGGSFGRGAHVHASPSCIAKACAGGFARAFGRPVACDPASFAASVVRAADRRAEGLLVGARRAGHLAFGEEARQAAHKDRAMLVVAKDAGGWLAERLAAEVAEGRAVVWRTKAELGLLFSREDVAIVAVRHAGVARQLQRTLTLVQSAGAGT